MGKGHRRVNIKTDVLGRPHEGIQAASFGLAPALLMVNKKLNYHEESAHLTSLYHMIQNVFWYVGLFAHGSQARQTHTQMDDWNLQQNYTVLIDPLRSNEECRLTFRC